jgi:hypothetical protein
MRGGGGGQCVGGARFANGLEGAWKLRLGRGPPETTRPCSWQEWVDAVEEVGGDACLVPESRHLG